jgi:hypothetical protein
MKGVSYVVDDAGNQTAVILDLKRHRRLWEDVYDRLLVESRRGEPRLTLAQVRSRLSGPRRASKRHG